MPVYFGERLRNYRINRGLSQEQLAEILGTTKQVISRYENSQRSPKITVVSEYAAILNLPLSYFLDDELPLPDNILPMPRMIGVPLVGTIACGEPILAEQNVEAIMPMPEGVKADFALRCKGDSMIGARIHDGDIVYIRQQPAVEDGQIAAVLIEDEATLKRVYHGEGGSVILQAANDAYKPMILSTGTDVRVLGLAVAFTSEIG